VIETDKRRANLPMKEAIIHNPSSLHRERNMTTKQQVRGSRRGGSQARPGVTAMLVLTLLGWAAGGCGSLFHRSSDESLQLRVVPQENRDQADLSAKDIITIMERVGFSDPQILQLGPELHRALQTAGAAEIKLGKKTEMAFGVNGERLFITSRARGTFVYNITSGRFGTR
jgi:hypothetical protein